MGEQNQAARQTAIGIKLFGRTYALSGRSAIAFVLIVPGVLVTTVAYFAFRNPESFKAALMSPLWISAALWIVMMAYWSAAAKKSAPVKTAESSASRARHEMLLNLALLLAFIRVPWTGARWLPASPLTPAIVSGELHGLIAVALCLIAYWRKTRMEERGLEEVFGPAYDEYRRASWALIPFVF